MNFFSEKQSITIIKDKILYGPEASHEYPELKGNIGEDILNGIQDVFNENGDFDWLINAPFEITGETSTCGTKRLKISEIQNRSRKIGLA